MYPAGWTVNGMAEAKEKDGNGGADEMEKWPKDSHCVAVGAME